MSDLKSNVSDTFKRLFFDLRLLISNRKIMIVN